jgi:hypothetical protein
VGLAQDLLQLATHLTTYGGDNPTQAALRRAVSTAYYALFHLLTEDAAQRLQELPAAFPGLERSFQHGLMKNISTQFQNATWTDWQGKTQAVPPTLQFVAKAFVYLQEKRHTADYDNHKQWTVTEVQALLAATQLAFDDWLFILKRPNGRELLISDAARQTAPLNS